MLRLFELIGDVQPVEDALLRTLHSQLLDRWAEAAEYAEQKRLAGLHHTMLAHLEAFAWLCANKPERALAAIESIDVLGKVPGMQGYWILAFAHTRLGNRAEANQALMQHNKQIQLPEELSETFLLSLWSTPSTTSPQHDLAYYFPLLPTILTGWSQSVTRFACQAASGLPDDLASTLSASTLSASNRSVSPQEQAMADALVDPEESLERYVDFDVHIGPDGHIVASSPEGHATDQISIQPPSGLRLALQLIERRQTDGELLKEIGSSFYDWLFPNPIHTHFQQTEAVARRDNAKVRLRLRIEAAGIAGLPLEFIYRKVGGYFLAVNPDTVFSRYLHLPMPPERVRRREGPLHMLVIVADPTDQARLNPDEWEEIVKESLAEPLSHGQVTLQTVKHANRKEIRNALLARKPDMIQFVGHGMYRNGKGYLALVEEDSGKTWLVDDERFASLFMGYNDRLGLISLATCNSAQSDDPQGFLGISSQLVQRGIPAVVAMQYEVYVKTAKVFMEDFYTSVAARKPVDWAVQSARKAVSLDFGLDNREFATPVLYMRAQDGNVFG
ncbi:MAG: CHAT domain-containing protein [Oscillochloris sp.]|nr:CHAT domain-containing protein [Oscillochloris sp.]